ncbi:MAG: response regulator [Alistipes sp.]|nr:response regulator [Alistipes sp.]
MKDFTILLVEDDVSACNAFIQHTEQIDDISIVSITNNSTKALADICDYVPDVVILDLELHNGGGSGLDVLQGLKDMPLSDRPYILITTNNSSSTTYEYARQLGADYIMSKHQKDYSEENVLNFLIMMRSVIQSRKKETSLTPPAAQSPHQMKKRIEQRIITELNQIGISPKATGYPYLIDAIQIIMDDPTQRVSTLIGKKYKKTESSVERAMQNAINKAWKQTDIDELLQYYTARVNPERGMPTAMEFIYYYATKLKNEYQ